MSIVVTGVLDLDPVNLAAAITAFKTCMAATRAEDGNEAYAFTTDLDFEGRFHIIEQWASEEAMDAHTATPHLADLFENLGSLGVTGVSLTKWMGASPTRLI